MLTLVTFLAFEFSMIFDATKQLVTNIMVMHKVHYAWLIVFYWFINSYVLDQDGAQYNPFKAWLLRINVITNTDSLLFVARLNMHNCFIPFVTLVVAFDPPTQPQALELWQPRGAWPPQCFRSVFQPPHYFSILITELASYLQQLLRIATSCISNNQPLRDIHKFTAVKLQEKLASNKFFMSFVTNSTLLCI